MLRNIETIESQGANSISDEGIQILKDIARDRVMIDQIDKAFCQEYIDYLLTEYRAKGELVSNFTLHTYYRILIEALCAAIRMGIIKSNPFTKINNPTRFAFRRANARNITIEKVRALIATTMKNEAAKKTYMFSSFCRLRISDIVGLKLKDIFVDRGLYRLAISIQKTKEPI